jgi:hypothetical protein
MTPRVSPVFTTHSSRVNTLRVSISTPGKKQFPMSLAPSDW